MKTLEMLREQVQIKLSWLEGFEQLGFSLNHTVKKKKKKSSKIN